MKLLMIIVLTATLSGCGYGYAEIEAAKTACKNYNGVFGLGTVGDLVTKATCTIDGVPYRIGRTQYQLHDGSVK